MPVLGTAIAVQRMSPPSWIVKGTQLLTYGDPSAIVPSTGARLTELTCSGQQAGQQAEWRREPRVSGGVSAVRASVPAVEFLMGANARQRQQTKEGVSNAAPQLCRIFAKDTRKGQAKYWPEPEHWPNGELYRALCEEDGKDRTEDRACGEAVCAGGRRE